MASESLGPVLAYVWKVAATTSPAGDGQLLDRFLQQREEAAFAALVQRHGPMVLSVCRNLLRDSHEAEDAFQATFLVLARRGGSIRQRASVASWLYGVACRVARKARAQARRRHDRVREMSDRPAPETPPVLDEESRSVLCAAIDGLPEKFRAPIVLCYFEGQTLEEAAQHLGWPKGTVASRLARARARLRRRLTRRGLTLSASLLATWLAQNGSAAVLPPLLAQGTVQTAVLAIAGPGTAAGVISAPVIALAEGTLKAMFLARLKITAVVLLGLILVAGGAGSAAYVATAGANPDAIPQTVHTADNVAPDRPRQDRAGAGQKPAPGNVDDQKLQRLAKELEELLLAEQWQKASDRTEELLAGDRPLAARVLALVLANRRIKARSHVIAAIGRHRLKEATPTLVKLLEDPDKGVRSWSATALGTLSDRSTLPALEKRLQTEPSEGVRHRIRITLAQLGRPYLKYFIDGLADRNPVRQHGCLTALGELKDSRAVPFLVKLLSTEETEGLRQVPETITIITGIANTIWKNKITNPDGSVSQQGTLRPLKDFQQDCDRWLAQHRQETRKPLDKPVERWRSTPEPFLPGLNVSFAMNAPQVLQVYKDAKLECQYEPQKRWTNQGTPYFRPETITASRSCLASLNRELVSIRYVFRAGRLDRIDVDRAGQGATVIEPLKKPLQLRRRADGSWTGLGETIVLHPEKGNAERQTYAIRLNLPRE